MKQKVLESVSRVRESKDVTKHKGCLIDMQIIYAEGGGPRPPAARTYFKATSLGSRGPAGNSGYFSSAGTRQWTPGIIYSYQHNRSSQGRRATGLTYTLFSARGMDHLKKYNTDNNEYEIVIRLAYLQY